jgi:hypothetical protein
MTTALKGVEGLATRPGRSLPPGKKRYPLYRRLGGPQGRSGEVRKISPQWDSIPGPSSPKPVAIPTKLPIHVYSTDKEMREKRVLTLIGPTSSYTRHLFFGYARSKVELKSTRYFTKFKNILLIYKIWIV